jgi:hypothetical protein
MAVLGRIKGLMDLVARQALVNQLGHGEKELKGGI